MATFLLANCQFGRLAAIKQNGRPFENVLEMNYEMVDRWNSVVTDEDQVIHLGNFAWDPSTAEEALSQLNGKEIFLIPGEHDQAILDLQQRSALPSNTKVVNRIFEQASLNATFAYWPLLEWPLKNKGHYLYYGFYSPKYKPDHKKKMINMACEFWNYTPAKISDLIKLFEDKDIS